MQSNPKAANQIGSSHTAQSLSVYSEPWWCSVGYNPISTAMTGGSTSNPPSPSESNDGQSQSNGGLNEEDDDSIKESQATSQSCIFLNHCRIILIADILKINA